jgi:uncharacterized protein
MKWIKKHIPTRETVHENPLLRPFARHLSDPALWRMTRRSVPRAVALGLGIGVLIPVMHTPIAAILAIPSRANVAIAAALTLVVNPLTYAPVYYFCYRIGAWELRHDSTVINPEAAERVSGEIGKIMFWIQNASGAIAVGVLTVAATVAVVGYFSSSIIWRWWLGSKWRARRDARRAARI